VIGKFFGTVRIVSIGFRIIGIHAAVSKAGKARDHATVSQLVIKCLRVAIESVRIVLPGRGKLNQIGHASADCRRRLHHLVARGRRSENGAYHVDITIIEFK
jgi:hypothetical protein